MIHLKSHLQLHAIATVVYCRTLAARATVHLFRPTKTLMLTGRNSELHYFAHQWLKFRHSSGITACYRGMGRLRHLAVMINSCIPKDDLDILSGQI